jgi:hypothetical protein
MPRRNGLREEINMTLNAFLVTKNALIYFIIATDRLQIVNYGLQE